MKVQSPDELIRVINEKESESEEEEAPIEKKRGRKRFLR